MMLKCYMVQLQDITHGDEMKKREGWEWKESGSSGYWVKAKSENKHAHKTSIFCPYEDCRRITGTIDDKHLKEYGICSKCYVMYVEDRENPLIDVEEYKKKMEERGY